MPDKLITKLVDAEPAPAKGRKLLYDTEVKGFAAAIYAPTRRNRSGNRSFLLNYRINGVERFYTIGSRPAWTVDAARIEADEGMGYRPCKHRCHYRQRTEREVSQLRAGLRARPLP